MLDAIVLCGGLGTRVAKYNLKLNKCVFTFNGHPFLWYILQNLAKTGVDRAILCTGHLHESIEAAFHTYDLPLEIKFVYDPPESTQSQRIVHAVNDFIKNKPFVLCYGDTFLPINIKNFYEDNWLSVSIAVYPGKSVGYPNNIYCFQKNGKKYVQCFIDTKAANYIDAGSYVINPEVINLLRQQDLKAVLNYLCRTENVQAYESEERFWEVGSIRGIGEFTDFVRNRFISSRIFSSSGLSSSSQKS